MKKTGVLAYNTFKVICLFTVISLKTVLHYMENAVNTNGRREKCPTESLWLYFFITWKRRKKKLFDINKYKVMNSIWFVSTAKKNYEKTL